MQSFYYYSPIGVLKIELQENVLFSIQIVKNFKENKEENSYFEIVKKQLDEYFSGKRKDFELNISFSGTDFQKAVWEELRKIPYGKTKSYQDIAKLIKKPNAQRAVGSACGKNSILLVVPCHRVISKSKALGGFAYDLKMKSKLLKLEGAI